MSFKTLWRIGAEWWIWLPAWLLISARMTTPGKLGLAGLMLGCIGIGLALAKAPPLWRRTALTVAGIGLVAAGIVQGLTFLLVGLWFGFMLWRGRFSRLSPWHYAMAFSVCCLGLIAISANEAWESYRTAFILLAVWWACVWFLSLNRTLLNQAGLFDNIATGAVRRAGRRYVLVYLAAGVAAIALTLDYGRRLLTPKNISFAPEENVPDPESFIPPPMQAINPLHGMFGEQKEPSVIWDYLLWVLMAFAAVGLIWLARLLWKDRTWSWRGLLRAIRAWFLRERPKEILPYVEERRSLKKEKKSGSLFASLFRRQDRPVWEKLDSSGRARRLYEDAVLAGMRQGYAYKPSDTPGETLEGIARWREGESGPEGKSAAYWQRLLLARESLLKLYEKARYSPHEVGEKEVAAMKARLEGSDETLK
ncbi:hypothetical protein ACF3MZ_26805 [Paenibacillaceae bacterium WGS1546]|uniref:hypothetical protein n=1 Tax=Cohnella sp. WGS1546 TaxID=3366810 RepID=UPI00372D7825